MQAAPYILTLKLDEESQAFFDAQRRLHFPPERNFIGAHLTLFHQLFAAGQLADFRFQPFGVSVTGLMSLGGGVAYALSSEKLVALHGRLRTLFEPQLIPQDKQKFRPHITIQNKVTPEAARALSMQLSLDFEIFTVKAIGLDLWTYLGGPWRHERSYLF